MKIQNRMRKMITSLLLLSATLVSQAQNRQWTLQECVEYAVEHNLTVEQFELDLENAKIDRKDAVGNMLPSLNGQASVSNSTGFSINPTNNLPTNSSAFSANFGASANLTLFDGLRNVKQLNRAKLNAIANQYRLENLKDDIRLNVANAYLQVLSNKEQLKTFRSQLAVTRQDLERTKELVASGSLPQGDLLEIEATAANQEQQIVNGEGQVLISRVNLAQLLQITDYENFDIAEESFEVPPSDILNNSAKTIFAKALEFRSDIKFSESNVALAKEDLQIAKGAYFPTLSAFFQYGSRYSDVTQIPDGTGGVYTPNFTDQMWIFDGVSYGAQLNIPIFNGSATRNNVKRSAISLEKARLQLEQDKLDLENTIQQAYVDVSAFEKAYEAAQKTLEARQLALDYAKDRYENGMLNAFDLGQAQARVDTAEAELISTKYNYIFRLKILEFYFGIPVSLN